MRALKVAALGIFSASLMSTAALSADLLEPVTDVSDAVDWSGFYVGAGVAGAAFSNGPFPTTVGELSLILGGNFQSGQFVLGAEGALTLYNDSMTGTGWLTSGEVRGGYLVTPETLLYGSLGAIAFDGGANYLTMGGGVEFMVADSLSLDLEAVHGRQTNGPYEVNSVSLSANWHF